MTVIFQAKQPKLNLIYYFGQSQQTQNSIKIQIENKLPQELHTQTTCTKKKFLFYAVKLKS